MLTSEPRCTRCVQPQALVPGPYRLGNPFSAPFRSSARPTVGPIRSRFNTARNLDRGDMQPRREGSSVESSTGLSNATKSLMGSVLLDERSVGHWIND